MSDYAALDPASLKAFISSSFGGDEETECARFAHIKLPLYRDPRTPWIKAVADAFEGAEGRLVFVTTQNEYGMMPIDVSSLELSLPAEKIPFDGLLAYLRSSRSKHPGDDRSRAWKKDGTWTDGILPLDGIIIFLMDPSLQADCALALIGIVQWALDMQTWPAANARILTMSTGDHYHLPSELIRLQRPGDKLPFLDFSLGDDWPVVNFVSQSVDDDGVVNEICQAVKNDSESSHLIISFAECGDINDKLQDNLKGIKEKEAFEMRTILTDAVDHSAFVSFQHPPRADIVVLYQNRGDLPLLPPIFHGYGNVHVVIGDRLEGREGWHHRSRQVVEFKRYTSNQERWAQLWWLEQPSGHRRLYSSGSPVDEVLQGGFRHHHRIDDAQLGGFIAGVYDLGSWGVDCSKAIECLLGNGARVLEMTRRLETQGILSRGRFALCDSEAKAFRAILPSVGYDHRLAIFASADCDPTVRLLKLQLAALLVQGIENTIFISDSTLLTRLFEDQGLWEKLLQFCIGSVLDASLRDERGIILDQRQDFEIKSHLFRAYMHHLHLGYMDGGICRQLNYATMVDVKVLCGPRSLVSVISQEDLMENEGCVLGVNHALKISNGVLVASDWTWIPQRVIAQWLAEKAPDLRLDKLLADCMEVDRTVDECIE
ncbi:hypothetical protein IL306_011539 [Fusarium sp. DS 682]|nr:hypothetical protein IL306_011539 [Fusarium sp. DS 682]